MICRLFILFVPFSNAAEERIALVMLVMAPVNGRSSGVLTALYSSRWSCGNFLLWRERKSTKVRLKVGAPGSAYAAIGDSLVGALGAVLLVAEKLVSKRIESIVCRNMLIIH